MLSKPKKTSAMQKETANQIGHRVQKQCKGLKDTIFSRELVALFCILIVGLILRGIYLREIVKKPDFVSPEIDAQFHDYWARGLAWGNWSPPTNLLDPEVSTSPYLRPPAYPYFLAIIYTIAGPSYITPRVVQMVLGLVNCVLAFILGRLLFRGWVGVTFAALMSTYWIFIYFEGELLAPVLSVFLSLCLILVLSFWRTKFTYLRTVAAGIVFGLSAVVRPNILLFGPVILAWGWWLKRRRADGRLLRVAVVGFVLGAAALIAPVTIRNYRVADDFVLITSNAGVNFYIGNNENADCVSPSIPDIKALTGKQGWTCFDYPTIVRGVERLQGRQMKHSEVSAYFAGKAIEFIRENPTKALALLWKKILLFWGPAEVYNNKEIEYEREHSVILRYLPRFPAALSLCIVGIGLLCLDFRGGQKRGGECGSQAEQLEVCILVITFMVTHFVSYLPFFAAARYRVAIIPFLLLFASYGLYRIYQFIREHNLTASIFATVIVIGLYAIAARPFVPYEPSIARWHRYQGNAYLRNEQIDQAIEEYRKAVRLEPADHRTHARLGSAFFLQHNYDEAIIHWGEAVRLRPNDHETHALLGEVFAKQGNIDKAILHRSEVVRLRPNDHEAYALLGEVFAKQGNIDKAILQWSEAVRLSPNEPILYYNLGLAFHKKGMIKEAIKHYREALRLKPDYVKAKEKLRTLAQKRIQGNSEEIKKGPNLNDNSPKDE